MRHFLCARKYMRLIFTSLVLLCLALPSAAQWVQGGKTWQGPASTFTVTYTQPNTAGNLLVMAIRGAVDPAITDTAGNAWQSTSADKRFWYAAAKGGANTVTVTCSSPCYFQAIFGEYSGSYVFDQQAGWGGSNGQVGILASVSLTTAAANELVIGYGENTTTDYPAITPAAGFTLRGVSNIFIEDSIQAAAGPVNVTAAYSSTVNAYQYAVSFKPTAPPSPFVFQLQGGPKVTFPMTAPPACTPADGTCSIAIQVCMPDGVTCMTGIGTLSLLKTVTLPVPQTQTTIVAVAGP